MCAFCPGTPTSLMDVDQCEGPMAANNEPQRLDEATVLRKISKWGNYVSYGKPIRTTKVIPMKTPLTLELQLGKDGLLKNISDAHLNEEDLEQSGKWTGGSFTVDNFIEEQRLHGRDIGMIVDLSNHECLYMKDLAKYKEIEYQHFYFVAKCLPNQEQCLKVGRAISAYVASHPDKFIGIHCSYGFNRTGFICCSYLIEELGFSVQEALAAFQDARSPGVKHQDFIEELNRRYSRRRRPPCEQHQQQAAIPEVLDHHRGKSTPCKVVEEMKELGTTTDATTHSASASTALSCFFS